MVVCSPLMQAKQDGSIGIYNLSEEFVCWRCQSLAKQRLIPTEAHRDIANTNDSPRTFHFFLTCQANTAQHDAVLSSPVLAGIRRSFYLMRLPIPFFEVGCAGGWPETPIRVEI